MGRPYAGFCACLYLDRAAPLRRMEEGLSLVEHRVLPIGWRGGMVEPRTSALRLAGSILSKANELDSVGKGLPTLLKSQPQICAIGADGGQFCTSAIPPACLPCLLAEDGLGFHELCQRQSAHGPCFLPIKFGCRRVAPRLRRRGFPRHRRPKVHHSRRLSKLRPSTAQLRRRLPGC